MIKYLNISILILVASYSNAIYANGCDAGYTLKIGSDGLPSCVPESTSPGANITTQNQYSPEVLQQVAATYKARIDSCQQTGGSQSACHTSAISDISSNCEAKGFPVTECTAYLTAALAQNSNDDGGSEIQITDNKETPKSDNPQCQTALTSTEKKCKGAEWSQYSAVALQLGASFVQMKNANNTKAACETAKKISALGVTSNGAVAGMCAAAVSSCKKACKTDEADVAACEEYNKYTKLAAAQSVENATAYAGSTLCSEMAGGECNGDSAYDNEKCTQFCFKPGRQNHPKCASTVANCANPTYAAQNVQTCTCVNNPFSPSCTTNAGTSPIPGSGNNNLNFDDSLAGADYDFDGVKGGSQQASTNAQQGSGSNNGGGFGGGSSVFGDDAGGGAADLPNKDILTGMGNSSGGGGIFGGGGGYNEGNGNAANKAGGAGGEPGIDLRAFLPGGKKDPTRNPASAGYADATITKANGLTNWQKVTRKMNEKRPELMP